MPWSNFSHLVPTASVSAPQRAQERNGLYHRLLKVYWIFAKIVQTDK